MKDKNRDVQYKNNNINKIHSNREYHTFTKFPILFPTAKLRKTSPHKYLHNSIQKIWLSSCHIEKSNFLQHVCIFL